MNVHKLDNITQNDKLPKPLIEAIQHFSDNRTCVEFVKSLRWQGGPVACPRCDSQHVKELSTRQIWKCYGCKKQFSVKVGTIFEDSALPLTKWLTGMWLLMNCRNGISSYEVARSIGITQKSAWHLCHRLREAMRTGSIEKLSGTVEADETYIGGLEKNRHANKKKDSTGGSGKTMVFGAVERGGKVQSRVIDSMGAPTVQTQVLSSVKLGSKLYTDDGSSYRSMGIVYDHEAVNHSEGEYVRGEAHSNTIENYWSLVKRMLKGTYIHVEPFHLDRYLDEQGARYNNRKSDEGTRFAQVASQVFGKRLTWKELTGAND